MSTVYSLLMLLCEKHCGRWEEAKMRRCNYTVNCGRDKIPAGRTAPYNLLKHFTVCRARFYYMYVRDSIIHVCTLVCVTHKVHCIKSGELSFLIKLLFYFNFMVIRTHANSLLPILEYISKGKHLFSYLACNYDMTRHENWNYPTANLIHIL